MATYHDLLFKQLLTTYLEDFIHTSSSPKWPKSSSPAACSFLTKNSTHTNLGSTIAAVIWWHGPGFEVNRPTC